MPLLLGVALAAALSLSGCGRKGPLDPPPSAAIPPGPAVSSAAPGSISGNDPIAKAQAEQATAVRNGFDAQGNPVAPLGQKKSFILDPLLQ